MIMVVHKEKTSNFIVIAVSNRETTSPRFRIPSAFDSNSQGLEGVAKLLLPDTLFLVGFQVSVKIDRAPEIGIFVIENRITRMLSLWFAITTQVSRTVAVKILVPFILHLPEKAAKYIN